MKSLLVAITFTIFSANVFAVGSKFKHIELCQLENEENPFVEFASIEVKKAKSLTSFQLGLINQYLVSGQYADQPLSLLEIKKLFSDGGEAQFDELWIYKMRSSVTGAVYIAVKSYPGDNPVGMYFDLKGNLVGSNGDDSISMETPEGHFYCGNIQGQ